MILPIKWAVQFLCCSLFMPYIMAAMGTIARQNVIKCVVGIFIIVVY